MKTIALRDLAVSGGFVGGPFGSNLVSADYEPSGVPVIRGSNMLSDGTVGGHFAYVSREKFEQDLARNTARAGDLVFTQRGTLGQVAWVRDDDPQTYIISQSQMRMTVDPAKADVRYILAVCQSSFVLRQIDALAIRTGVPHINLGLLKQLRVPDSPLKEQRAIGEVFGALDEKIAANRRAVELGKDLLAARWNEITSGATESVPLERIVEISPRVPPSKADAPPYLDMKNMPEHGLLVSEWNYREPRGGARFRNGDTLVARITPCFENGKIAWVDFLDEDETGYGSTEYIVLRARESIPRLVPYVIAASQDFRVFAARHRTGTSGRQRVEARELASYEVVLPAGEHLAGFDAFAESLVSRLGAARTESRRLATTRDELLPLLMSGRITVKDAESRIEEVV